MLLITIYFILVVLISQTLELKLLEIKQIDTSINPKKLLIFLHGLGADNNDFDFLPNYLKEKTKSTWRVVLPNANIQPVSVNNGHKMRSWYNIFTLDLTNKDDIEGIQKSIFEIIDIIKSQIKQGFENKNIYLGGFSQGGVISLATMNQYNKGIGGVIALSTYLPKSTILKANSIANKVFMAHGEADSVINIKNAKESRRKLIKNNHIVTWRTYPMEHNLIQEELEALMSWINNENPDNY